MADIGKLGPWVRRFLLEHLIGERNLSVNKQRSYRDTLDFGLDIFLEFDVRELEQLDRLLQLRRHDKGLPLSQLQAMRKRHAISPEPAG